jgi:hypothetical protein
MRDHLTTWAPDGRSLTLRLLKPEDAPRVQEACSDPGMVKWLGGAVIKLLTANEVLPTARRGDRMAG